MSRKIKLCFFIFIFKFSNVYAGEFNVWQVSLIPINWSDPADACAYLYETQIGSDYYRPNHNTYAGTDNYYFCAMAASYNDDYISNGEVDRDLISCSSEQAVDFDKGGCVEATQSGKIDTPLACNFSPKLAVSDPINIATGNVYSEEIDYFSSSSPFSLTRTYNSVDGKWRHSLSSFLYFGADNSVVFARSDGKQSVFRNGGNGYVSNTDVGHIVKNDAGWTYFGSDQRQEDFSATGKLQRITNANGQFQTLSYAADGTNTLISITDGFDHTLQLTANALHQPIKLAIGNVLITYQYDADRLVKMTKTVGAVTITKQYLYENTQNTKLLTGVIDERGIRYLTWTYDSSGRAISNEGPNGIGKVSITYNADGTSTLTNELGKRSTYQFVVVNGVKHITSINGEPTPNCPASNSSYTYDSHGQVLTKTDAKGFITTYTYNDRGLETSRTEASGTSLARTTTTTWDPSRFLRTQVVEPTRTTVYSYDSQGRLVSRVDTPK